MRKVPFQSKEPHLKLRNALLIRGIERNCKNKNVLEFDVEKDGGIVFFRKKKG